jgi:crotonobetainyl-CoA:carnitine CoA-transferase CaiB-like acyl-CoA transferase
MSTEGATVLAANLSAVPADLPAPGVALAELVAQLGLPADWLARTRISGMDPVVPSRYRPGLASAVALAAQAIGVAEIWRQRGSAEQQLAIDLAKAAVPGLRTLAYVKRDGHSLQLTRPASENQVFFETRDGRQMYLLRHAFYHEHFSRFLACLDCSPATESIARAVARRDALELEDALADAKAVGAIARTRDEWLAHPQGRHLRERIPVEIRRLGPSEAEPLLPAARPLSGLRVVDMGHVLAGPVVSRVLAEQGADVLHVSAPHLPDPNHVVADTGFGKRTAFADLRVAADREQLLRVIAEADVFVHSWRPGVLDRYGLSAAELSALRPGLIYANVSCYGSSGPWGRRAGYDPLGQVVSGLAVGEGSIDKPVLASTFTLNDYLAGYLGAAGILSAVLRRARDGGSHAVEVSLTGCSMWLQELGKLPESEWPSGQRGVAKLPLAASEDIGTMHTPYGVMEHALPIVNYSATPAHWDKPPSPAGTFPLRW